MNQNSKAQLIVKDGFVSHITAEAGEFFNMLPERIVGRSIVSLLANTTLCTCKGSISSINVESLDDHTHRINLNPTLLSNAHSDISIICHLINPLIDNLKTPMSKIKLSTKVLIHDSESLSQKDRDAHLHNIFNTIEWLSILIDNIESNGNNILTDHEHHWEEINLRTFCRRIVDEQMTNYSHVTCELDFQGETQNVIVQPQMFQNIIANLLSNAAKYSPSNSLIHMTVYSTEDDLKITIEDQGLGMTATDLKNLFTPFYKGSIAKDSTDPGLGLAIVKHSVDIHHGTIHFESTEGEGTTVTITIPNHHTIEDSINQKAL